MGTRVGLTAERPVRVRNQEKKEKPDGIRQSERLLLTWLIDDPRVYKAVKGLIGPDDFSEELYRRAASMVFEGLEAGNLEPAGILNRFINDQEEYKEVAALFNTSVTDLTKEEKERAFSETVMRVKRHSLEEQIRSTVDIGRLQELMKKQAELGGLHISLN